MSRHNDLQKVTLSEEGKQIAKKYYEKKPFIKELPETSGIDEKVLENNKKFLQFQVEVEAHKIQKSETPPEQPGTIPKLPIPKTWMDEKKA